MAGHLPALSVSVPVVNLVLMVELFWGPFSAKTLSVYSVAGSRLVSTYSTVFPDTVRVISGTEHETHKPRPFTASGRSHQQARPRTHTPPSNTYFQGPRSMPHDPFSLSSALTSHTKDL